MFIVHVADNFHHGDESESYKHGEFATWVEAVAAARTLVDRYLLEALRPEMTEADLCRSYQSFGEDPYIVPIPEGEQFSAWEYARERCRELTAEHEA